MAVDTERDHDGLVVSAGPMPATRWVVGVAATYTLLYSAISMVLLGPAFLTSPIVSLMLLPALVSGGLGAFVAVRWLMHRSVGFRVSTAVACWLAAGFDLLVALLLLPSPMNVLLGITAVALAVMGVAMWTHQRQRTVVSTRELVVEQGERVLHRIPLEDVEEVRASGRGLELALTDGTTVGPLAQRIDAASSEHLRTEIEHAVARRKATLQPEQPPPTSLKRILAAHTTRATS
ncbi:MAG: hypothetical protein KTR31_03690 [Myxococcales bacterium]|nr:hypothetical protein [Myxococcales bacterium]